MDLFEAGKEMLDLIYPARCPICGGIVPCDDAVCPDCRKRLPYITSKRCMKCGKPVEETALFCDDCTKTRHSYTEGMGVFLYDDVMRESMAAFKYRGRSGYARALGQLVYEEAAGKLQEWDPDLLVPVPIHPARLAKRGYNQAELLAEEISSESGIPVSPHLLIRKDNTKVMKKLGRNARRENMAHAFFVPEPRLLEVRPRIVLVDDIYTTGSTVDAAADVLLQNGAEEVFFLSVCIGSGFMVRY